MPGRLILPGQEGPPPKPPRIMIDLADSRQFGLHCKECGSRKVVYFISFPLDAFEPGAYCYTCLLQRCRQSRMIPFPIDETLLNSLKRDMGLTESTPPVYIQGKPFYGGKK